jgi:FtsH-binding integral membrane protein
MVANFFIASAAFDVWISVIGLVIFAWFIIYDMNVLKQQALVDDDRIPLLMSLWLFINFINIFLFLLRLMWGRN